jgi:hypothetical protein
VRQREHSPALCATARAKPPRLLASAIAVACALVACGPRDAAYDTSNFRIHGAIAPPDLAVPSNLGDGPSEFNGLYLEGSGAFSCCWIAPRATLLVRKRKPAAYLVGGFRVPDLPRFAGGQVVTIRFGNDAPPHRLRLQPGVQRRVSFPLPANLRNATGLVPIDVTTAVDFVPRRDTPPSHSLLALLHLRARAPVDDTRSLGVVLLYLYFE